MPPRVLHAAWPLERERLCLGSLLNVRQELELVAQESAVDEVHLHFLRNGEPAPDACPPYASEAFRSTWTFRLAPASRPERFDWPDEDGRWWPYESLLPVDRLRRQLGRMAHLTWAPSVLEEARRLKTHLAGERELICLHLKNQSGGPEESNASFDEWERFLSRPEVISDHTYLVLGDDRLPEDLLARPHVTAARSLGVSLGVQLALVTIANGFIGMASGIAQAAVFSPSPYAIFKHPRHHVAEMVRELGEGDRFPLAGPHQRLIRQPDTEANLFVAWQTLITAARCAP